MPEPPAAPIPPHQHPDNQTLRVTEHSAVQTREMEQCIACGSRLVHPVSWEETPDGFEVLLRCPECLIHLQDEFSEADLARYATVLDEGIRGLIAELRTVARANMQEYAQRFSHALHAGHIHPEDF